MSQKLVNFLSSTGIMLVGVFLLFVSSITVTSPRVQPALSEFPLSEKKIVEVGGDVAPVITPVAKPAVPLLKDDAVYSEPFTGASLLVVDDKTNTVLYSHNSEEVRSLASITKLMSALVLRDMDIDWASSTVVAEDDVEDSSKRLVAGQSYTLETLWQVGLIGSSNTAIKAMVRATGLTEEQFAERMNQKAHALNLTSLRFVEPTGLDNRNMGTASDVVRLLKAALKDQKIAQALGTGEYYAKSLTTNQKTRVWSTNWLLTNWIPNTFDKDLMVGKTGYITDSGYNFTVRITDKGSRVVRAVVLGAATNEARFTEVKSAVEWVLSHYVWPDEEGYDTLVK